MRFADAERADADALAAALDAADEEYNEGRDAVKKSLKKAKSEKRMATVRKARERITEADFGSKATQRSMAPKARNKLLGVAFVVFVADAVIAVAFALMTPSDERLVAEYISRTQMRAIYLQGFVALIDARSSAAIVLHVILGIVQASLDVFLEAAAVKLSQAIFFSSMQTANPTSLRLAFVFVLIMLRVAAATLVFRVGWLSGRATSAPSRHMPKVITSLLASGGSAPLGKDGTEHTAALSSMERPLTIELIERLMVWLVPFRERTAAVGLGRRQLIVIASFVLLMSGCALALPRPLRAHGAARGHTTPLIAHFPFASPSHPSLPPSPPSYTAFSEYWSILGDQDELFEEPQKTAILGRSFECAAQFRRHPCANPAQFLRNSGAIPAQFSDRPLRAAGTSPPTGSLCDARVTWPPASCCRRRRSRRRRPPPAASSSSCCRGYASTR